jgi:hypothetical protein
VVATAGWQNKTRNGSKQQNGERNSAEGGLFLGAVFGLFLFARSNARSQRLAAGQEGGLAARRKEIKGQRGNTSQ